MADGSDAERTEDASPRRLEQAREEGQVPRSRELSTFAVLIASTGGLWLMGPGLFAQLSGMLQSGLRLDREVAFDPSLLLTRFHDQALAMLVAFAPFFILMVVSAIGSGMALSGWLFSWKGVQPDFTRLNPARGLSNMFSVHSLVELAKAIGKTLLIGAVAAAVMWHYRGDVLALASQRLDEGLNHLGHLLAMSGLLIAGSMLAIVLVDVPFQIWEFHRKLRMTREELRQEARQSEGDPQVKGRIRAQQRELARKRMMSEIPKADVIVMNPVHYAVALRYESSGTGAPRVVAKGENLLALKIRELGELHNVPILEAPPLARALYHHTELGDEIPEKLYTAVAEVLAYIYQLRRYREYGGAQPVTPQALPVPLELDPAASKTEA